MKKKLKSINQTIQTAQRTADGDRQKRVNDLSAKVEKLEKKGLVDSSKYQLASSSPLSFIL
ncbi:MAG: hypothetical protein KKD00_05560 [Gammaproteobacteria bacterium]|nr:hypothetical protein [Gammaproteobacteria bacterium]